MYDLYKNNKAIEGKKVSKTWVMMSTKHINLLPVEIFSRFFYNANF